MVIPILFVFFRRYSKWYNPILYTIIVSLGNIIGILISTFITDFPSMYSSIFLLNLFNIVLWICGMIGAKLIKLLFKVFDYIH